MNTIVLIAPFVIGPPIAYLIFRFVCKPAIDRHIQREMEEAERAIERANRILNTEA